MYRLIALDLDGTLLRSDNTLSEATVRAVREATEKGAIVTIATGRMFCSARQIAAELDIDAPLITYNGGMIRTSREGKLLFHQPMEETITRDVLSFFREKNWHIQSYIDDVLYVREMNEAAIAYGKLAGVSPVLVGERIFSPEGLPTKLLSIARNEDEILQIREEAGNRFGNDLFIAISNPLFLDIAHKNVSKGHALSTLIEHYGVTSRETLVIGDSENDLAMFELAGFSVAMGNASETVKSAARAVTRTNDEDGVAEALRRYAF